MSSSSLSGSFESLGGVDSEVDLKKSTDNIPNTWPRKKRRKERELEFFHDLSAVFCGILHQRRMLAVWQKRFCKVKDQCLICYRYNVLFALIKNNVIVRVKGIDLVALDESSEAIDGACGIYGTCANFLFIYLFF